MKLETYPNCFKKSTIMSFRCGGCNYYQCWHGFGDNNVNNEID